MGQYFIRDDYVSNTVAHSFDNDDSKNYWNVHRIKRSRYYQYDVYQTAKHLILEYGYQSVLDVGSGPPLKVKEAVYPVCSDITFVDQPSVNDVVLSILPSTLFVPVNLEMCDTVKLGRQFDVIIFSDVVEHLVDPTSCLHFIKRHLAANGRVIISTPEREILRGPDCTTSPKPDHIREWAYSEFSDYILSLGFTIENHKLLPPEKLWPFEKQLTRLTNQLFKRYHGCQMIVAKK
jgi:SAM-dependent methyltransferase